MTKRKSFFRGCVLYCCLPLLVLALVSALPIYWFCFHTTPLRVSEETTFVLGPMTSDGKRIDYFLAMEERYYPPEMQTDDNGYRLIVRAMGVNIDNELLRLQVYEKLGLDPNIEPMMKPIEGACTFLHRYARERPDDEAAWALQNKFSFSTSGMWTFDDFPMLKEWYEENTAGLDLLAEAVRKPTFFIPFVREHENTPVAEAMVGMLAIDTVQQAREWARALSARARYRLGIGNIDEAIDDIITIHLLAQHTGKQGTLIYGLVGIAIEGMGRAIGIGSNPEFPSAKKQIERLIAELDALQPRVTVGEMLERERLGGLAALQDMYWWNNLGYYDVQFLDWLFLLMGRMMDINIAMARMNERYDMMITGTMSDDNMLLGELEDLIDSWHLLNPLPLVTVHTRTNRIIDVMMALSIPAVQATREAVRRQECSENIQRLTLALLLYEIDNGTLPEGDWREAIKPYLGENWERYFRCPSARLAEGETNYAMIGGVPNLVASPQQVLVVEVMQPQRLDEGNGRISFEQAMEFGQNGLGGGHVGGINVGLRSGAVRFINANINSERWRSFLDGTATTLP